MGYLSVWDAISASFSTTFDPLNHPFWSKLNDMGVFANVVDISKNGCFNGGTMVDTELT